MLEWDDLRFFSAFAREGSLAAAARLLGVEHATVSRRIAALEASLNLKLVDRRGRLYQLTEDGVRVSEYASQMENASFALKRYVAGEEARIEGEVILSAPPAFLGTLVAQRLGKLREKHPGLQIRLVGAKATASLARQETDIAITFSRPHEQSVVAKSLGNLGFSLHASEQYLLARKPADYEFIGYDPSGEGWPQQDWLLAKAAGRPLSITSNDLRIQAMAAVGHGGVVLLPDFLGSEYGLQKVDEQGARLDIPVWLAFHEDLRASPRIRVVVDFLVEGLAAARQP